jgi:hypothetical protein
MAKNSGKSKMRTAKSGPAPGVAVYNGPVRVADTSLPNDTIVARLSYVNPNQSGGSTGLQQGCNNLGVTTTTDWASYVNLYDEYRVLGFELDWLPHFPGGNAAVVHASGVRFSTHSADTFVAPTLDVAVQHADWSPFYTGVPFKMEWKMSSLEEAAYYATGTPATAQLGALFATAPSASSTTAYGNAIVTYAVQFRGRK